MFLGSGYLPTPLSPCDGHPLRQQLLTQGSMGLDFQTTGARSGYKRKVLPQDFPVHVTHAVMASQPFACPFLWCWNTSSMHKQFRNNWCAPKLSKLSGVLPQNNLLLSICYLHIQQKYLKGKKSTKPLNCLIQPEIKVLVIYHPGFT